MKYTPNTKDNQRIGKNQHVFSNHDSLKSLQKFSLTVKKSNQELFLFVIFIHVQFYFDQLPNYMYLVSSEGALSTFMRSYQAMYMSITETTHQL